MARHAVSNRVLDTRRTTDLEHGLIFKCDTVQTMRIVEAARLLLSLNIVTTYGAAAIENR